jgi:hypothetical protein
VDLAIVPHERVGPVAFGMTKDAVRSALGPPNQEFVRNPQFAPGWTEWLYDGIDVCFDPRGTCAAVGVSSPSEARLGGIALLEVSGTAAWAELRRLDPSAVVDAGSLISRRLGIAIHAPDVGSECEEPDEPALDVLAFRPDYYDLQIAPP